ncbi:MAG: OsmC family protein, partial [Acidobacteria bacterium]|nr:OsmC family protein [Acidobacteriota bacterium]
MSNEMRVTFPGGKKVYADYNGFEIATDQHTDAGGEGSAPEPYNLFLASLATCAGIYILGFCQRRQLPVEDITLTQSWERDPETSRMATIRITVETPPEFPEKYHKALE